MDQNGFENMSASDPPHGAPQTLCSFYNYLSYTSGNVALGKGLDTEQLAQATVPHRAMASSRAISLQTNVISSAMGSYIHLLILYP